MPEIIETADAPANVGTQYSIAIGQTARGQIGAGDVDWVRVDLVAGQQYTFSLVGSGPTTGNLRDSLLRLRDANGGQLLIDDDGGPGAFSTITFTATSTGAYYLDVSGYGTSVGQYSLSVTAGGRAGYDADMAAAALLRANLSWSAPGAGASVTWGIRQNGPASDAEGAAAPFSQLAAAQISAVQSMLNQYSEVANVEFTRVNSAGTTNDATMLFGNYSSTTDGAGAYAYYPGRPISTAVEGDVWLNTTSISTTSLPPGSYSHFAVLHEIGHAMGLAHPGDYNAAPGVAITYANNAQYVQDSQQFTVMSYFDESATGANFGATQFAQTLMLHDIYALQLLYGPDATTRSGNTTYGFNSTELGTVYDFASNTNPALCIWDGGGADKLDVSGFGQNQLVDLRAGNFSNIGPGIKNVSIAFGAEIEQASGGSGNDLMFGNAAANRLGGNGGNDNLWGGLGPDHHDGGIGFDYARFDEANHAGFTVSLSVASLGTGVAAGDTFSSVEGLILSSGNDRAFGDTSDNYLYGLSGDDSLWGGLGADALDGGAGFDYARYDDASYSGFTVSLYVPALNTGVAAGDTFAGIEGLILSGGNDWAYGDAASNYLYGLGGNDSLFGSIGGDYLHGGQGTFDYVRFDDASYAGLVCSLENQGVNTGVALGDTYVECEGLILTGNSDTGIGDSGDNYIYGLGGPDTLYGRAGRDNLFGGAETGVRDTFVFDAPATAANADTIWDFQSGVDKVALSNSVYRANQTIRFEAAIGELFWAGASNSTTADDVLIATLSGVTSFDAGDYYFY